MADAIGLAASVLQMVQVAWTVTRGLYELADEVGSAGESIRIFTSEFDFFIHTLDQLGHALETSTLTRQAENAISDIVDITSLQIMLPFRQLLDKLGPLLLAWRDSPYRMRQLGRRLQWAFSYKNKILFYRGALNELKANMTLFLQVIALRQSQQPLVYFLLRESVESNLLALKGNISSGTSHLSLQGSSATARPSKIDSMPSLPLASTSRALTITDGGATLGDAQNGIAQSDTNVKADTDDDLSQDDLDDCSQTFADIPLLVDDSGAHTAQNTEEQIELWAAVRTVRRKVKQVVDESLSGTRDAVSSTKSNTAMSASPASPKPSDLSVDGQGTIIFQDSFGDIFNIPVELVRTYRAMASFIKGEYRQASLELGDNPRRESTLVNSILNEQLSIVPAEMDPSSKNKYRPVPESRPILPNRWEAQVRAGWAVILVLDYPTLSRAGPGGPSHARFRVGGITALHVA